MNERKIVIEITESDTPPRVTVDGKEVKAILLNYTYESAPDDYIAEHKFNLTLPSTINGINQTQGIAFDLNMARDKK